MLSEDIQKIKECREKKRKTKERYKYKT